MGNIRYDFHDLPADGGAARPIYCAISRYDGSWRSVPHSHAHAELFYCMRGKGYLQIAGEKLPLRDSDCFLINPSVAHTELSDPDGLLEYIVIGVSGVRFSTLQGRQPRYCLIDDRSNSHELLPYFQDMLREVSRRREGYLLVCTRILDILLHKIRRHIQVDLTPAPPPTATSECAEAKRLIDESFTEAITLDWLAEKANISKYYLSRAFHRQYGLSPMHYLIQRRVHEAQHLLQHTDHSLSAIAALAGFSSSSYFSQAFRRLVGQSPREYRKAIR
ncbi:MAG: AraC family transcriptional regulator [Clostridiales bacterium]|nr:AraC family transcriptional regulator [Clostridiales bacterium]